MGEPSTDEAAKMRASRRTDPQVEFEKILSRLGSSRETIKEAERTIEAPDATTKITYGVEVDPRTSDQAILHGFAAHPRQVEFEASTHSPSCVLSWIRDAVWPHL